MSCYRAIATPIATSAIFLWLIVALSLPPSATAGTLQRCRNADGTLAYQSQPCSDAQTALEPHHYDEPIIPASGEDRDDTGKTAKRAKPGTGSRPARVSRTTAGRASSKSQIVAYACSSGAERWVQQEPCPKKIEVAAPRSRKDGRPAQRNVQQRDLRGDALCRALREGPSRAVPGESASETSYRLNLLRERAGC